MQVRQRQSHFRLPILPLIAGIILVVVALLTQRGAIAGQLHRWQMLPRQTPYSELYFTKTMQQEMMRAGSTKRVAFSVTNREHRKTAYYYSITFRPADGKDERMLVHSSFDLEHNRAQTINRAIALPPSTEKLQVRVILEYDRPNSQGTLATQRHSIHYWTDGGQASGQYELWRGKRFWEVEHE